MELPKRYLNWPATWLSGWSGISLVMVGAAFLVIYSVPHWPQSGTINVTREDYNVALKNWHSHGIEEYEMVINYGAQGCGLDPRTCGTWKLRVKGDRIDILGYSWFDVPTNPSATPADLKFLTVDSLFREVDETLNNGPFVGGPFALDYTVKFDPALGYPTEIQRQARQPSSGYVSTDGWPVYYQKDVHSLKVTRSK
jgi:hypothetical protein